MAPSTLLLTYLGYYAPMLLSIADAGEVILTSERHADLKALVDDWD